MSPPACVNHYTLQHTACWKCCVLSGKICSQEITLSRKLSAATSLLRKNLRSFWRIGLEHRCSLDTGFLKACYESGKECAQKISLDCVPMIWKSSKNFFYEGWGEGMERTTYLEAPHIIKMPFLLKMYTTWRLLPLHYIIWVTRNNPFIICRPISPVTTIPWNKT